MMKSGLGKALVAIMAAATLTGCGPAAQAPGDSVIGGAPPTFAGTVTTTPAAAPTTPAADEPVLPDGRSPVYLTTIDVPGHTITFDLIELYLGLDAATEWKKDHPGATEVPPLDGVYVRNNNTKLRTLPVSASATVNLTKLDHTTIPFASLPGYDLAKSSEFWITVKGGVVTLFEEQFRS